jgi:hypothetical protein
MAAARRLAHGLRQNLQQALGDEAARDDAREIIVSVDHDFSNLVPGRHLSVTALGIRSHRMIKTALVAFKAAFRWGKSVMVTRNAPRSPRDR